MERDLQEDTCVQSSKNLEVDAVWKAGFDDLSEGSKLKPVGQSSKVVLYTASVAGALTFSKVGLNREGMDGRDQQKGQKSQKTEENKVSASCWAK